MKFYQNCMGGELHLMTYADAQKESAPAALRDKIMHSHLKSGSLYFMTSDASQPPPVVGSNVNLCINCTSLEEIERLFAALGKGGKVTMPLADSFWGARFGMLTDPFGVNWMLNFDKPK